MSLTETEAIVLRSYNLAEADRIVIFLTHDAGVVRGVAKGAKRPKSKFGSALEPFSVVQLTFFQKEALELVSVSQIELTRSYFEAASDPEFLQKFAYLAELLIAFSPPHDPNATLYRMVKACLETAAEEPWRLPAVGLYFELWLLRLGGYLPDWTRCNGCKRELRDDETVNLQANFHPLCTGCRKTQSEVTITGAHRQMFAAAQKLTPSDFAILVKDRSTELGELSQVLKRIISQAIGREVVGEKSLALSL
jgi:DNA repair protein RecO (recombination protein O)